MINLKNLDQFQRNLLIEYLKRNRKIDWFGDNFFKQNDLISSPARMKAVQCTRRAGKSYGAAKYLCKEAMEHPGSSLVYIALTRESAKRILYKDILKEINQVNKLGAKFNGTDLSLTFPNGSIIYLVGADKDQDQMAKLLGQKFRLCVIDEAAFFTQDLKKLVMDILKPAVADYKGTICMISTTSDIVNSFYHDVMHGVEPGWETFKWTAHDNPFMADRWAEEIAEMIEVNPLVVETAQFRRMYLNEWVIAKDALVYRFNKDRNTIKELPRTKTPYQYILGIDLGWEDATAFVVLAYTPEIRKVYVVETYKKSHMTITMTANKIKELDARYKFQVKVIDNASKQSVEEIKSRHELDLIPAEKAGKRDFIELLNDDMILGYIQLLPELDIDGTPILKKDTLKTELKELVWDEKKRAKGIYEEHSKCDNHLTDAYLYAWRWCYNYGFKEPELIPVPGSIEALTAWEKKMEQAAEDSDNGYEEQTEDYG